MRHHNSHRASSHRCCKWNYASRGWYHITIITQDRNCLFGYLADQKMHLNVLGEIIADEWEKSKSLRPYLRFDTYTIMPDHIHMLIQITKTQHFIPRHLIGKLFRRLSRSISSFVAAFKRICTIRIRAYLNRPDMQVWQPNYHDSIKRTPRKVHTARDYIINNPRNAPPTPSHLIYNIPC